jgi:predicted NAD/FAD-dependent oxidoreductase
MTYKRKTIAIIGAGMAGLSAGQRLQQEGFAVEVFEKSRGVGGRMSTRRNEFGYFDHGAQYFTASDPQFKKAVHTWVDEGLAAVWQGTILQLQDGKLAPVTAGTTRYVGTPYMNSPVIGLSNGLNIALNSEVESIERGLDGSWQITFFETSGATSKHIKNSRRFDAVIVSTPVPQAKRLLGAWSNDIDPQGQLDHDYHSVWATLVSFTRPAAKLLNFDGCFVNEASSSSLLSWVASSTEKPNRPDGDYESWILHGKEDWSLANLENTKEDIAKRMLLDFKRTFSIDIEPSFLTAHRWLYARPKQPISARFLYNEGLSLGVCGDWCAGPKVEGAYLSGRALSETIVGQMKP